MPKVLKKPNSNEPHCFTCGTELIVSDFKPITQRFYCETCDIIVENEVMICTENVRIPCIPDLEGKVFCSCGHELRSDFGFWEGCGNDCSGCDVLHVCPKFRERVIENKEAQREAHD